MDMYFVENIKGLHKKKTSNQQFDTFTSLKRNNKTEP